ncbi:hypothetical protein [Methylobacterium radiotolerans]|jgi:hypothetical protein|uniref:Uncharacterized protein n=2 Tax=Alphaproteobacteria TaxID=28211 RepID=B1M1B2_METRJ|nr:MULTISPECIES: hypothetical protein [Methylobacterium]ACB26087.1 conserved hypothetical protein [Methylobacterium radiotolerans JCM 2831]KTR97306.1 hypothetical protein SB3_31010 [Methylobacterium radiotolerans]MDE3745180.1 hypothetical protein [Methylobacterium radiotolerans]PVY95378.1 hypothetical protein C7388_1245 [Methylobacterium organophilum]GEM99692.1 hypothetical protein MRA01_42320 [Methylobacterium radiotolerans]
MQPIDTNHVQPEIARLGPVAAASLRPQAVEPFEAFVAPGDVFRHPREVLRYPGLSRAEKRAILASWASDARAVDSCPTLRCLPGCRAEPVPLSAVLEALQTLDAGPAPPAAPAPRRPPDPAAFIRRWRRGPTGPEPLLN